VKLYNTAKVIDYWVNGLLVLCVIAAVICFAGLLFMLYTVMGLWLFVGIAAAIVLPFLLGKIASRWWDGSLY